MDGINSASKTSPSCLVGQVAKEHLKGDPLMLGTFDQAWGALVRRCPGVVGRGLKGGHSWVGFIYAYAHICKYMYIIYTCLYACT